MVSVQCLAGAAACLGETVKPDKDSQTLSCVSQETSESSELWSVSLSCRSGESLHL